MTSPARPIVISLHGIRTRGAWQKDLTSELNRAGFDHEPLDYGFFLALVMLWPQARRRQVEWFREKYDSIVQRSGATEINVIAHSFGTYLVVTALERFAGITFRSVVLCGSIVDPKVSWSALVESGRVQRVLNEHGRLDLWARAVGYLVPDAGPSGVAGFEDLADGSVLQRDHPTFHHSDYFYPLNYRSVWIPFLRGEAPIAIPGRRRPANSRFRAVSGVVTALLVAAGVWAMSAWITENGKPTVPVVRSTGELSRPLSAIERESLVARLPTVEVFSTADTLKRAVEGAGLSWHASDQATVGIDAYPSVLTVELLPFISAKSPSRQLTLGAGRTAQLRFADDEVFAFGLTYQQGLSNATFTIRFVDRSRRDFEGESFYPESRYFGFASRTAIRDVLLRADTGTFSTKDLQFGALRRHPRVFHDP